MSTRPRGSAFWWKSWGMRRHTQWQSGAQYPSSLLPSLRARDHDSRWFAIRMRHVKYAPSLPKCAYPPILVARTSGLGRTRVARHGNSRMRQEIEKLSAGIVDKKAQDFVESRRQLAASERAGISSQYGCTSALRARLSRVAAADLNKWIIKEAKRSGRSILASADHRCR